MCVLKAISAVLIAAVAGSASASADTDLVSKARMAAVQGDHATCAKLADEARRQPGAGGRVHHLYATCQTFAADARRSELSDADYATELGKAIEAYRLLLQTPGLIPHIEERASVEFVIEELEGRIARLKGKKD
jgi:hypothetical protein